MTKEEIEKQIKTIEERHKKIWRNSSHRGYDLANYNASLNYNAARS
jgi:uncharacterized protein (UPF0335 family)